jgi:hypothetical protein
MCRCFSGFFFYHYAHHKHTNVLCSFHGQLLYYIVSLKLEQPVIKRCLCFNFTCEFVSCACSVHTVHFITSSDSLYDNQWRPSFHSYTPVFKTGCIMVYQCPTVRPSLFHMLHSNLRTPWPIHFTFHRGIGIDGLMVCILYGEISNFHSSVMGLYSSNCTWF